MTVERWLAVRIRHAAPTQFLAAAALLGVYALWLFAGESPWTSALAAAGGRLPEQIAGFPAGEPAGMLSRLGDARGDYFWQQAFDLAFVALAVIAAATAIAIALKQMNLAVGDARYLLLVPALYFVFEVIENTLLALFASGVVDPVAGLAFFQQFATTGKLAAGLMTLLVGTGAATSWAMAAAGDSEIGPT